MLIAQRRELALLLFTYPKAMPVSQCRPTQQHWVKLPMCRGLQETTPEPQSCSVGAGGHEGAAGGTGHPAGLAQGWQAQGRGTGLQTVALPQRLAESAHVGGFDEDEG